MHLHCKEIKLFFSLEERTCSLPCKCPFFLWVLVNHLLSESPLPLSSRSSFKDPVSRTLSLTGSRSRVLSRGLSRSLSRSLLRSLSRSLRSSRYRSRSRSRFFLVSRSDSRLFSFVLDSLLLSFSTSKKQKRWNNIYKSIYKLWGKALNEEYRGHIILKHDVKNQSLVAVNSEFWRFSRWVVKKRSIRNVCSDSFDWHQTVTDKYNPGRVRASFRDQKNWNRSLETEEHRILNSV